MWEIAGQKESGGSSKSIPYTASNHDGTIISVYPIFSSCNKISYGPAATYKIERYIDAKINVVEDKFINNIGSFTYKLEGYIPAGTSIQWSSDSNVNLVSGQGTSTAKFQTSNLSSRYVKVKAVLTYASKQYSIENSDVWVGKPDFVQIRADQSKLNFLSKHILYADSPGATSYSWRLIGNARFENGSTTISTSSKQVYINTLEDPEPGMGQILRVTCETTNKYGVSNGSANLMFALGFVRLEMENTMLPSLLELGNIKSIKVYNLTGSLVYSEEKAPIDFDLKNTTLPDGIYIIEKSDGKDKTSEKILLKR